MSKSIKSNLDDRAVISKVVFYKIVQQVIMENKDLFVDKSSYLKLKNDKSINVEFVKNNMVDVSIDVNVKFGKDIKKLVKALQDDIKMMIEHITDFKLNKVNVNVVGIES
ncbi:putative alkaline shock family protein YloU [Bacilli bacterium PM5-3]|nr:putative alkaline shock family protein YloU [Bacilli bacterium PM5-3]MDH6603069.1 putative alkaline shock family protein YloU [Bacilli bacterium PM5-9]